MALVRICTSYEDLIWKFDRQLMQCSMLDSCVFINEWNDLVKSLGNLFTWVWLQENQYLKVVQHTELFWAEVLET